MTNSRSDMHIFDLCKATGLALLAVLLAVGTLPFESVAEDSTMARAKSFGSVTLAPDFKKQPTLVKSDSLTLLSEQRVFTYTGNVELQQGDFKIISKKLEGSYGEDNRIKKLVASGDVVILKGTDMRGTCQRAVYDAATETVTMNDNPEVQQGQSVLTADKIVMLLNENRSQAEGEVRIKLVKVDGQK